MKVTELNCSVDAINRQLNMVCPVASILGVILKVCNVGRKWRLSMLLGRDQGCPRVLAPLLVLVSPRVDALPIFQCILPLVPKHHQRFCTSRTTSIAFASPSFLLLDRCTSKLVYRRMLLSVFYARVAAYAVWFFNRLAAFALA